MATASFDRSVKLAETGSGRLLSTLAVGGRGNLHAALSPDGRHLAVTADRQTVLYEVTGLEIQSLVGYHLHPVASMAFAPDGRSLACLTMRGILTPAEVAVWPLDEPHPRFAESVCRWQLEGEPPALRIEDQPLWGKIIDREPGVAFHPGGTLLASSKLFRDQVYLRERHPEGGPVQWRTLPERALNVSLLCFARDGKSLWGVLRKEHEVISLSWPDLALRSAWSNTAASNHSLISLAAGERWVLAGSRDLSTKLLRTSDGQLERRWDGPGGPVQSVALSADEALAASGTQTGHVQVVRLPGGEVIQQWQAHTDSVESLAFHPREPLLVSAGRDRKVRLWQGDGDAWNELLTLSFDAAVRQVGFSPDGSKLAVLVQNERAVRVWHLDRLRQRLAGIGLGW